MKGIDIAKKLTAQDAARLAAGGWEFAGRYLIPDSGATSWKALTAPEAEEIRNAGLGILLVWETAADRVAGGAAAGRADGAEAYRLAAELGADTSAVIYFAVDYDAQAEDFDAIGQYLAAARGETGPYETGVYGGYRVIEDMWKRGVCKGFWQCCAWSDGNVSPHATAYQYAWQQTAAGLAVDLDEGYDGIGLWEENMTQEKFNEMAASWLASLAQKPEPEWSVREGAWARATAAGLVDGKAPEGLAKRDELVAVLYRAGAFK